ncbi:MAG: glycosyltransferase [Armatimonadetes bacterium]|nr:glycosyltransferase [Armatimonadota bacterium]
MPEISIITPYYNGRRHIEETLRSVRAQVFADWEHIIVDDGSTDDAAGLLAAYAKGDPRLRVVAQENGGVAAARNRGYAEAHPAARYVLFLDQDDLLHPDMLLTLRALLDGRSDLVGAYALSHGLGSAGDLRVGMVEACSLGRRGVVGGGLVAWPAHQPTTLAVLAFCNCIFSPGQVLIRRSSLDLVGEFDPSTCPADDYDMWIRLSRHGDLGFVDRALFFYRLHDSNASRDISRMHRMERAVRRKQRSSPENTPEQRALLAAGYRLSQRRTGLAKLRDGAREASQGHLRAAGLNLCYGSAHLLRCLFE